MLTGGIRSAASAALRDSWEFVKATVGFLTFAKFAEIVDVAAKLAAIIAGVVALDLLVIGPEIRIDAERCASVIDSRVLEQSYGSPEKVPIAIRRLAAGRSPDEPFRPMGGSFGGGRFSCSRRYMDIDEADRSARLPFPTATSAEREEQRRKLLLVEPLFIVESPRIPFAPSEPGPLASSLSLRGTPPRDLVDAVLDTPGLTPVWSNAHVMRSPTPRTRSRR